MMIMAERRGKLRSMFLLAIGLLIVAMILVSLSGVPLLLYLGMWLFFVGFNYLEATLPSLVSKLVFVGGKGAALGIFSTCQFLGAFAGGAIGGYVLQQWGSQGLLAACLLPGIIWLALFIPGALFAADSASDLPGA